MPPLLRFSYLLLPFWGFNKWTSISSGIPTDILKAQMGRKGKSETKLNQNRANSFFLKISSWFASNLKEVWLKLTQVKTCCKYKTYILHGRNMLIRQYIVFRLPVKVTKTSPLQLLFKCVRSKIVCARSRNMSTATKNRINSYWKSLSIFLSLSSSVFLLKPSGCVSPHNKNVSCVYLH